MNKELKPVRCGCGGEPVVGHIEKTRYLPKDRWYIGCPKCDICTGLYDTEAEVIEAWNRAMGRKTGKWRFEPLNPDDAYCSQCNFHVYVLEADFDNYNFCPNCGADMRL